MTRDEEPRENVGLITARKRDIARRGLVGFHRRKRTFEAGIQVHEADSELGPYEYNKQAMLITKEGGLYGAFSEYEFDQVFDAPGDTIVPGGAGSGNLPPSAVNYLMYPIPRFMEAGLLKRLIIRSTYLAAIPFNLVDFYLTRMDPKDARFVPEDIIVGPLTLNFAAHAVGLISANIGDMETNFDQDLEEEFIFPFDRIPGQDVQGNAGPIRDQAIIENFYLLVEEWRNVPGTDILRMKFIVEDRGR